MRKVYIYGLIDPQAPHVVRYVGKANQVRQRLTRHVAASRRGHLPVQAWIRSLVKAGRMPMAVVLCTCSPLYWEETETHFIRLYRHNGHPLLNVSGGGGRGYTAKRAAMAAKLALFHQ